MSDWRDLDDIELIRLAKSGDSEAFGQLYERHVRAVFRFLYAHLDNRLDAEDLAEDIFLRVWNSLSGYHERGIPFIAYLFRIARNGLIDFYRRSKPMKEMSSIEDIPLSDRSADPGDTMVASLEQQEVRLVLEQLREDYRTVLVLRFVSDLSPDEIAQVMGRSAGAVRVLQHRALAAMKDLLED
jgi:RNA polymerase sigma-70 factor (ECF subfamily)